MALIIRGTIWFGLYLLLALLPLGTAIASAPDWTAPSLILGIAIGAGFVGLSLLALEFETCIAYHDPHTLAVPLEKCQACHVEATSAETLSKIRMRKAAFDGDGDTGEGIAGEVETMRERLLLAMRIYAVRTKSVDKIVYDEARNPYFFDKAGQEYSTWTPRLLQAAYIYQYATKGLGGYAHNGLYTLQLLYDNLNDLGANTAAMTRPETR